MRFDDWLLIVADGSGLFLGGGLVMLTVGEKRFRRAWVDLVIWFGVALTLVLIGAVCTGIGIERY